MTRDHSRRGPVMKRVKKIRPQKAGKINDRIRYAQTLARGMSNCQPNSAGRDHDSLNILLFF